MDRRIRRTRNSLIEALPELLVTHGWDEINVQRLCDQADVSRSAFYTHFNNKAEVLDLCFERLEEELLMPVAGRGIDIQGLLEFVPNLLSHVESHCEIMRRNSKSVAGLVILNRFKSLVKVLTEREFAHSKRPKPSKDQIIFITGGIFAMLEQWNEEHCRTSVKALTRRIDVMVSASLSELS